LRDNERNKLRQSLLTLEKQGKVSCLRKNRWAAAGKNASVKTITGSVRVMEKEFGLFAPDDGGEEIYIARDDLKCALHENRVAVELAGPVTSPGGRQRRVGSHAAYRKTGSDVSLKYLSARIQKLSDCSAARPTTPM
jgi:exoribonuclease R